MRVSGFVDVVQIFTGSFGSAKRGRRVNLTCCEASKKANRTQNLSKLEVGVCLGPTCSQSGSQNTLEGLKALTQHNKHVDVSKTGCLGLCGDGPNVVLYPKNKVTKGVKYACDMMKFLKTYADGNPNFVNKQIYKAIELKDLGNVYLEREEPLKAVKMYSESLEIHQPEELKCRVLANRSAAYSTCKEFKLALKDANLALDYCGGLSVAWLRKAQAHEGLEDWDMAIVAYDMMGKLDPTRLKVANERIGKIKRRRWFRLW